MANEGVVELKIVPSVPDDMPVIYSNHVTVNRGAHECVLTFFVIRLLPTREADDKTIPAQGILQVALPTAVARGLITALSTQMSLDTS